MGGDEHWSDLNALPATQGSGWSVWADGRQCDMAFPAIAEKTARWVPPNPILVGAPEATRFVPPVLVEQLEKSALQATRKNLVTLILGPGLAGMILVGVTHSRPQTEAFYLGLLMLYMAVMFAIDYFRALRHRDGVAERALFFYWLRCRSPAEVAMRCWAGFALAVGALQLLLLQVLGGHAEVFHAVGTMYARVEGGELWRLLSGPYLHYTPVHFLTNLALLAMFGSLTYALFGRSTIALFAAANVFCAWAQMTFGGRVFDNFGGLSGGIYALIGAVIVAGLLNRRLLPKAAWLLVTNLAILGLLSAELLSDATASVAHFSGLVFGGLAGIAYGYCGRPGRA